MLHGVLFVDRAPSRIISRIGCNPQVDSMQRRAVHPPVLPAICRRERRTWGNNLPFWASAPFGSHAVHA